MKQRLSLALAAGLLAATAAFAQAQTPAHHGLLGRLFRHHAAAAPGSRPEVTPGHMSPMLGGQIVGNKNTHVYHMPGDRGSMPSPQNRVYFRTVAQAQAAGYRAAGHTSVGGAHAYPTQRGHHRVLGSHYPNGTPVAAPMTR